MEYVVCLLAVAVLGYFVYTRRSKGKGASTPVPRDPRDPPHEA